MGNTIGPVSCQHAIIVPTCLPKFQPLDFQLLMHLLDKEQIENDVICSTAVLISRRGTFFSKLKGLHRNILIYFEIFLCDILI